MISNKKECFAYIRVSTDDQLDYSPDSQLRLLKDYATQHDMIITSVFKDLGISGRQAKKRPQFQEMIDRAKRGECDAILVWKYSRFARNQEESVIYKSMLRKMGVDVISISEELPEDWLASHLVEAVYEIMDEQYSRNLSVEVKRGMQQKAMEGGYNGPIPIGYIKEKGSDTIPVPDPVYAPVIERIFDEYLSGKALSDIAYRLNADGFRTKRGGKFENRVISYILRNPFYTGHVRFNYYDKESKTYNADPIIVKAKHEPIIPQKIFDKAQHIYQTTNLSKRKPRTAASVKHWLSGVVKCSVCGGSLGYHAVNKSVKTAHFACWKSAKGQCKNGSYANASQLEQAVIDGFTRIANSPELNYERIPADSKADKNLEYYNNLLSKLDKKEKRIKEAYINGIDTLEEYKANKEIIHNERMSIQEKLNSFSESCTEKNINTDNLMRLKLTNLIELLNNPDATDIDKANALRSICDRIIFSKETFELKFYLFLKL